MLHEFFSCMRRNPKLDDIRHRHNTAPLFAFPLVMEEATEDAEAPSSGQRLARFAKRLGRPAGRLGWAGSPWARSRTRASGALFLSGRVELIVLDYLSRIGDDDELKAFS